MNNQKAFHEGNFQIGMKLWDYYAAAALSGMSKDASEPWFLNSAAANEAANIADAMLAER